MAMGSRGRWELGWRVLMLLTPLAVGCDYFPASLLQRDGATSPDLAPGHEAGADGAGDLSPYDGTIADLGSPDGNTSDGATPDGKVPDGKVPDAATTDCSGPSVLFSDDFESGTLTKWTTSGSGDPWYASTDKPNGGLYSAKANKTGTFSYMEGSFSPPGLGTVTFAFQRRLVGLDAADDFSADYFDQGSWTAVEHLGTGAASEATFSARSYPIPNTATKIRFGCLNGPASKACVVDDVVVSAK